MFFTFASDAGELGKLGDLQTLQKHTTIVEPLHKNLYVYMNFFEEQRPRHSERTDRLKTRTDFRMTVKTA